MNACNLARWVVTATTVAVLVVVTGGCATTPDAADLVSEQATTGEPVSEAEAAAALLDYFGAVNKALQSGDTDELAALTGPECPCRDLVGLIHSRYAEGGELVGASFDAEAVTVLGRQARRAQVRARVMVSRYNIRNADGLMLETRPARQYVAAYTVELGEENWRVVDVRLIR
ncbi:MAG: hypothetical protein ACRDO0_18330 [Nocardioidaceae bacterium]